MIISLSNKYVLGRATSIIPNQPAGGQTSMKRAYLSLGLVKCSVSIMFRGMVTFRTYRLKMAL